MHAYSSPKDIGRRILYKNNRPESGNFTRAVNKNIILKFYQKKGSLSMKIEEKPITRKVMDEVLRITEKAMMYNNTPTKQEYTGDKPTFFVEFNGHCGDIDVH